MTTVNQNFTGQATPSIIDTEYYQCNFSQFEVFDGVGGKEGVRIFPGDDTPRIFNDCNMNNCIPPPDSELINCKTYLIERNAAAPDKVVTVGSNQVSLKQKKTIMYGRLNQETLEYEYKQTPGQRVEIDTDHPDNTAEVGDDRPLFEMVREYRECVQRAQQIDNRIDWYLSQ